ncbi:unnamed protein product [Peronospora destructor]|uniref:BTB domain-containing protein n=1 Tax=Peronospora destructor TaxID=86335 RepID=A0AAV0V900_9STRA|nr:unnamed protein product [Peronospora destructor]
MHTADYVKHLRSVLIFRGGDGRDYLNDLHAVQIDSYMTWTIVKTRGHASAPRASHGSTLDGDNLLGEEHGPATAKSRHDDGRQHRDTLFVLGGSGPSAKTVVKTDNLEEQRLKWRQNYGSSSSWTRSQPWWNIYEDEVHQDTISAGDDAEAFEDDLDNDEEFEDAYIDEEAMVVAQGLANDSCGLANPNEICKFADVEIPKRREPLVVVGRGPRRRAGHTCTVVDRMLTPRLRAPVSLPSPARMLRHALATYVGCEEFADISFLVEGRVVYAHKVILSALSAQFHGMFSSGFREAQESQIAIQDMRYEVFLLLLEYIYTDTLKHAMTHLLCARQLNMWFRSICHQHSIAATPQVRRRVQRN